MPQRNDNNPNRGGQGGQSGRPDVQRTPGVDQGGGGVQSPKPGGGQGQQMDRPDEDDTDRGSGRDRGMRDDQD